MKLCRYCRYVYLVYRNEKEAANPMRIRFVYISIQENHVGGYKRGEEEKKGIKNKNKNGREK